MRLPTLLRALVLVCTAAGARAAPLQTVILPPEGEPVASELAEQLELALELDERLLIMPRAGLMGALDKQDPFSMANLGSAMQAANVDVLVRVVREGVGRRARWQLVLHDQDGLDVTTLKVGALHNAAAARKVSNKVADRLGTTLGRWANLRRKRAARHRRDQEAAARAESAAAEPAEERHPRSEDTEPADGSRRSDEGSRVLAMDEGEDDLPPPPENEASEPPRAQGRSQREAAEEDEDETPPFMEEEARQAKRRKPRRALLDDDAPPPRTGKRGRARGALLDDDGDGPQRTGLEGFVFNLYSLRQPSPYFVVAAGPQVLAWSYTLRDGRLRRRASTCSPTPSAQSTWSCIPHGGADLWLEAWPIRYLGMEANVRGAGTIYPAARSATTGRPLTQPVRVLSVMGEGHVALKARFVNTFGPAFLHGIAAGVRVRAAYSRNVVERQTPFVAVPGFHAYQLGGGAEMYVPLLWKHLSFDGRAEFTPLVRYQETGGVPQSPQEFLLPSRATLSNPGSNARTVGWRADGGVRLTALAGLFVEVRAFHEGFFTLYTGTGSRIDPNGAPITDGRVVNLTQGMTLAVGWLFPQGLAPLYGTW